MVDFFFSFLNIELNFEMNLSSATMHIQLFIAAALGASRWLTIFQSFSTQQLALNVQCDQEHARTFHKQDMQK